MSLQVFVLTNTYATSSQQCIALAAHGVNAVMHGIVSLATILAAVLTSYVAVTATKRHAIFSPSPPDSPSGPFAMLGVQGPCAANGAVPCAFAFWLLLLLVGCGERPRMYPGFLDITQRVPVDSLQRSNGCSIRLLAYATSSRPTATTTSPSMCRISASFASAWHTWPTRPSYPLQLSPRSRRPPLSGLALIFMCDSLG